MPCDVNLEARDRIELGDVGLNAEKTVPLIRA